MRKKNTVGLLFSFWLFLILMVGHGARIHGSYRGFSSEFIYHVCMGHAEEVKKCLQAGVDVNEHGPNNKETALHVAAVFCNLEVLKVLLNTKGVKIDARDDEGETPFVYAAIHNCRANMQLLLVHKANINAQDNEGNTSLHLIAKRTREGSCKYYCSESKNAIPFLLKAGADPSIKNHEDKTPCDYATEEIQEIMKPFVKEVDEKASADEELSCSICYEGEQGKSMRILDCNHSFHKECIDKWLAKSKTCPLCRSKVS